MLVRFAMIVVISAGASIALAQPPGAAVGAGAIAPPRTGADGFFGAQLGAAGHAMVAGVGGDSPADVRTAAEWIDSLADPDPRVRATAADAINALGANARRALRQATQSDDPQIRARASELLSGIPLVSADDPPSVRQQLNEFENADENVQMNRVRRLGALPDGAGLESVRRVLADATSVKTRWAAADVLRGRNDAGNAEALRQTTPDVDNLPQTVAAAWAWVGVSQGKAMELMRQSVDQLVRHPGMYASDMDSVFAALVDYSSHSDRPADAAEMLRLQRMFTRSDMEQDVSQVPLTWSLLGLHARRGPFVGIVDDLLALEGDPQAFEVATTAAAAFAERIGMPVASLLLSQGVRLKEQDLSARLAVLGVDAPGKASPFDQLKFGDWLLSEEWNRAAMRHFQRMIDDPDVLADPFVVQVAGLRLSVAAERAGEYALSAEWLESTVNRIGGIELQRFDRGGKAIPVNASEMLAKVAFLRFRAAAIAGDDAARDRYLQETLAYSPSDSTLAMSLVPYLAETRRNEDADALYARALQGVQESVAAEPLSPESNNNLAWFMARCGRDLDAAETMSRAAVAGDAENAAYIDTLAEVRFRQGDAAEAVQLETRALQLRPADAFMHAQLRRFSRKLEESSPANP